MFIVIQPATNVDAETKTKIPSCDCRDPTWCAEWVGRQVVGEFDPLLAE